MKEWQKILPQHERLRQIVQISYELLCNKIVGGSITIQNEACLQMHLGVILIMKNTAKAIIKIIIIIGKEFFK